METFQHVCALAYFIQSVCLHANALRQLSRSYVTFIEQPFCRLFSILTAQTSDVLAIAFRPDGRELCSAALDGNLYFWDVYNG